MGNCEELVAPETSILHSDEVSPINDIDHEDLEDDDDELLLGDTSESEHDSGATKKKKRKKRRKKKTVGEGQVSQPNPDAAAIRAAEKRFSEEIASLSSNNEETMWVRLSGLRITDGKVDRLCAALRKNQHVLSLDLSDNDLTDQGVSTLCDALRDGAAPDLIELKLLDNPRVTVEGLDALKALEKCRKNVRTDTGSSASLSSSSQRNDRTTHQVAGQPRGIGGDGGGLPNSSLVKKYFQVGGDDDDDGEVEIVDDTQNHDIVGRDGDMLDMDPEQCSIALWEQVLSALDASQPSPSALAEPLRAIAESIAAEMDACVLPMLGDTSLDELKPFTAIAARHLSTLRPIMDVPGGTGLTQFSKDAPVDRAGSHRIALAELVSQLLRGECPTIASTVAESQLLPQFLELSIARPTCGPLQIATLRAVRHALAPACGGAGLARQLVSEDCSLAKRCLAVARSVEGVPIGLRPPHAGFAITFLEALYAAATGRVPGPAEGGAAADVLQLTSQQRRNKGEGEGEVEDRGDGMEATQAAMSRDHRAESNGGIDARQAGRDGIEPTDTCENDPPQHSGVSSSSSSPPSSEQHRGGGGGGGGMSSGDEVSPPLVSPLAPWHNEIATRLEKVAEWQDFTVLNGPLYRLLAVQRIELGGPRPARQQPPMGGFGSGEYGREGGGGGGQLISGPELLAFLQGLSMSDGRA